MFKKFGDYMYYLLFAPLKKVAKKANQLYIFFKVIGKLFDAAKGKFFLVREESMIASTSEKMLPVHGLDREMPRLKGETIENYRTRLSMKFIIASEAGGNEAIRYVAKAFGYENIDIQPDPDPEKWAEASVQFIGGKIVIDDRDLLLKELNKIKPAGGLLTVVKEQRFTAQQYIGTAYIIGKIITIRQG
jgi:hypothetical protein